MNSTDIVMDMIMTPVKLKLETEKLVYTTARAKTYHNADCKTLMRSSDIITITESEAKAQGKEPCSLCLGEDHEILSLRSY